ncbi:outer membrane protein assembly factor BamB [Aromatoleum petrolei]|uniref:Outer membrane protein assembly factor BamB n=1 Tax=Aromatoleum petrolei TaxID=76116 RepID=A0ABX1MUF1_9RHOO|nr:outer membrane protein assembly factor BamB [Aromatoleum petrolei]NMF91580.1 outer membrane protein assembly factor BamB [Aromatoleum petrolei]QTQ37440.1 Outer membrane protein assembly factor [Aromatoleum petrolei]
MKRPFTAFALAASLALLAGCSSLNPFAESGPKPAKLPDFKATAELRPLWQARIGKAGPYVFQPAVVGEDVYAAAHDGAVARFKDGKAVWSVNAAKRLSAGVGSNGKLAVVATTGGEIVALDAANGAERWRAAIGAEVLAAPAVGDAIVVVRASDSRLIGLDANTGARRWVFQRATPPLSLRSFAGVTLEGPAAVAGYPGGKLVAVSLANGGQLWELTVATPKGATELERVADVAGTPVIGRKELCAVTYQGRAACFDASNGNALWSREVSSSVGMDRDSRLVVITDDSDAVQALDGSSGANVWKQSALPRRGLSRPLIVGDYVAVGDFEGYIHLLKRADGTFAARARADSSSVTADMRRFGSGGFVVQTSDGGIHVYEAR